MMKWVLRDYFAAFRLKKIQKGNLWLWLYFLVIMPLIQRMDSKEEVVGYLASMIPIIFCMFASQFQSMGLPKQMYLCPISKEMRREYIVKIRYVRIVVPILVGILGCAILLISGSANWMFVIGVLLNVCIFSIILGSGISISGQSLLTEKGTMNSNITLLETFSVLLGLIMGMLFAFCVVTISKVWWVGCIFIGVVVFIQLPMLIAYLKNWQEAVERAISYERSYVTHK